MQREESKAQQTFHVRRVETKYLCGFKDLEESVVKIIMENNGLTKQLNDKVSELTREIAEHKVHVKQLTNQRDVTFQDSVKSILEHQVAMIYTLEAQVASEG
jgi:hypothetical protein